MLLPKRSANFASERDMPDTSITAYQDPLDVLRRFAPTPFHLRVCVGRLRVRVESNDPRILAILAKMTPEKTADTEQTFLWRIIRDPENAGGIEPAAIFVDGALSILKLGSGVFAGVDGEHRELLGFVGTGVCDHAFGETVVPLFVQLTLDAARGGAGMGAAEFALTRGYGNE
jgi:hypothetical protein